MRPSQALAQHHDAVCSAARRYRVCNPRVFGSVLHGHDAEGSDLDLLVSTDGVSCRLAPRETMLLQLLAMPLGSVVLQDTLVDMLWPDGGENQENALFSLVRRLRRKLDGLGFPADALTAVRGRGYKLRAPLRLG